MTARNDPTSSAYRTGSTAKEAAEWGSVLLARGFFFFSNTFYASALVAVGGIQGTWCCSILL